MKILQFARCYELKGLGNVSQIFLFPAKPDWLLYAGLVDVLIDRSIYLNEIQSCIETRTAIEFLRLEAEDFKEACFFEILDEGHMYRLHAADGEHDVVFVKRNGGPVARLEEYRGIQTQEVLRMLIDYKKIHMPVAQIHNLRNALTEYEVRASRRKDEKLNRATGNHAEADRPRVWRPEIYADVSIPYEGVERLPVGKDGHIKPLK